MAVVDKVVSVEKSALDMVEQLAKLLAAVKAAGGFQASAIPAEVGAVVAALPAIVADCEALPGDFKDNKLAFVKGLVIGADELVEAILAK